MGGGMRRPVTSARSQVVSNPAAAAPPHPHQPLPNVVSSGPAMMTRCEAIPGEISIGQINGTKETVNRIFINTSFTSLNTNIANGDQHNQTTTTTQSNKRSIDQTRTTVQVTEDELDWLYLFRQKPGPSESIKSWLKRVNQVAGVELRDGRAKKVHRGLATFAEHDDELSEIDATPEDLDNFDTSNMEDLFE
jgi:hypothetical protein